MPKTLKIVLAGGGTGGPTSPLLAVAQELKKIAPETQVLFLGTEAGPEQQMVSDAGINFVSIPAGKLRRYFALSNFTDMLRIWKGYRRAKKILTGFSPDLVFAAGSFVAVPVAYAAKKLGIKVFIHQQDATVGLANRLIVPFADFVTTAFDQTAKEIANAQCVGNPVREEFLRQSAEVGEDKKFFQLASDLPVLLIVGGATGAAQINTVVSEALPELLKAHQVIHITGPGKKLDFSASDYHQFEFLKLEQMQSAMRLADIVIARAGLSTLAELSALGKVSVIVPMPDSHQEANARLIKDANAAVVLSKEEFTAETLVRVIVSLKFNQKRQELLSMNMKKLMPHDSAERIAKIILERYGK